MEDLKSIKKDSSLVDKIKNLGIFQHKKTEELVKEEPVVEVLKEYTNEDVWSSIKNNYVSMGEMLNAATTPEQLHMLSQKADVFNKLAQNMLKGIKDDYDEKNRDSEYALRQEELRIKRIHEVNETLKLAKNNKEFGATIVDNVVKYLNVTGPSIEVKQIEAMKGNK